MDIWHTCEPDKVETIGWVGRTLKELDPDGENPLAGINIGVGTSSRDGNAPESR